MADVEEFIQKVIIEKRLSIYALMCIFIKVLQ